MIEPSLQPSTVCRPGFVGSSSLGDYDWLTGGASDKRAPPCTRWSSVCRILTVARIGAASLPSAIGVAHEVECYATL